MNWAQMSERNNNNKKVEHFIAPESNSSGEMKRKTIFFLFLVAQSIVG